MEMKGSFNWIFQKTKTEQHMERKQRRTLYRIGGYGMQVMRSLFPSRKKISTAGSTPNSHGKKVLKKNTLFAPSFKSMSVVIGPRKLPGHSALVASTKPVPELLNAGGSATITSKKTGKKTRGRYRARPYVNKAGQLTAPKLIEFMRK